VYNKYQVFNFTSHSSTGLEHDSLGSCKIKFARKILALPTNQTLYLLISILFVESSHAYPANNLIKPGNMTTINTAALTETNKLHNNIQSQNEVTSNTTTHSLQTLQTVHKSPNLYQPMHKELTQKLTGSNRPKHYQK